MSIKILFLLIVCALAAEAFIGNTRIQQQVTKKNGPITRSRLRERLGGEGYGPFGSLTRQGPVPFLIRLAKPDTYEAAVDKYMLLEKCSRLEAQANMDAYFQDPNGWAGNKLRERKGGAKLDYTRANQDPSQLALTAVWAVAITSLFVRIFQVQVLHQ